MYMHGRSGQYFEPEQGQPKNNLLEMAREGLRLPLAQALRAARQEGKEVVRGGLLVRSNGEYVRAKLKIKPLKAPETLRGLQLVTIGPEEESAGQAESVAPYIPASKVVDRDDLERELQYTRENLQTTIEELETSNEELKSSNEELQSTNEELQSANEELETSREETQSLNEELNTVNAELKTKVEALTHSRDDMKNLLNSMQVAAIFLDNDLRVKRYTAKAQEVIRLIESDIGRPLSDLTSSLQYDGLTEDCRDVLANLTPKEQEIEDNDGRWFMVRLIPYRTMENVIDGVVMTIVEITRAKRADLCAEISSGFFESIVQTVRQPLVVLDADLRVVQANDAFCQDFATESRLTAGMLIYELGNGQWDIPELRKLLEEILPKEIVMTDFRVEHDFPEIGRRAFLLNARRLRGVEHRPDMIFLSFEDVTEATL